MIMNDCIKLIMRSPHRYSTTIYLPHTLMRLFFGNADYMSFLKDIQSDKCFFKVENAENIKSYETDPTISSLVLLECLILTGNCNDTVHDNIQQFVLSDKSLRGYAVNYELNTVQDIEFAISCKTDYLSVLRLSIQKRANNVIAKHRFDKYSNKKAVVT